MVRRSSARWKRRLMFGGLAAAGIGYFGWHAHHGEYGLFARERAEARVVELGRELEEVRDERRSLERRVNLLKAESLDPDILEERSREALGLAHPNDVVILRRPDVQRRP